ncbi:hypothetical protein [Paenibacillus rigui]|uniref:PilZ domain-containing protein n=1 Tax=Paenibacillus rigui TaxID=554312 RepID=A0A229UPB1_9BACL|nr:hypothetical protein [Paenibacillus rigui]OXM85111.1 hypothetical protein CF651_15995 [Paenibacillus rigui]
MNEMLNVAMQSQRRAQLASIQCRLSVLQVDNRPVQTRYALVEITNVSRSELFFKTPLSLPAGVSMTYAFQLLFGSHSFHLTGSRLKRLHPTAPYEYAVEFQMNGQEKRAMIAAINRMMEDAPTIVSKILESYSLLCSYEQFVPRKLFQT